MRTLLKFAVLVVLGVLFIESVHVVVAWWKDELLELGWQEAGLLLAFPVLIAVWWRKFSIFGRKDPACLVPGDKPPSGRNG